MEDFFKRYTLQIVIATCILGTMGIIAIFLIPGLSKSNISNILGSILLYLTFIVLAWYAWETRQLKLETSNLRKVAASDNGILKKQSRPYLRLQKIRTPPYLQLVNEGKGIAVNIEPVYVKGRKRIPLLKVPTMAAAPHSKTISFIPTDFPKKQRLDREVGNYIIKITYEDVEGRKYEAIFESDVDFNDKFSIISQEEVLIKD